MEKRGEITVFLTLIFLSICSLLCGLAESARTAGARYYARQALNAAADSLMAQYHRGLWENYRIFGLEYREESELEGELQDFLDPYLKGKNWYPLEVQGVQLTGLTCLTDQDGEGVEQQILAYMKYGIWDQEEEEGSLEQIQQAVEQARNVQQVSSAYQEQAKEAVKLEQYLDELMELLDQQNEIWEQGKDWLQEEDGQEFLDQAKELRQVLDQIPQSAKTYEEQAKQLNQGLEKSRQIYEESRRSMGAQVQGQLDEEIGHYQDYASQEQERRKLTRELEEKSHVCRSWVEETEDQVQDILDSMEEWEDAEEDEDEPDWEELWDEAQEKWQDCPLVELNTQHGMGDRQKEGFLERVGQLASGNLLKLLLPQDGILSEQKLDLSQAPSRVNKPKSSSSGFSGLPERWLLGAYILEHFPCYEKQPVQERSCAYQVEYMLYGQEDDPGNLGQAAVSILAVREGLNLIHILGDSAKRQEARTLALAIAGAVAILPLVEIIAFFVMAVWALGEALLDVQALLRGETVPLLKTAKDWKLGLNQLLDIGRQGTWNQDLSKQEKGKGMDYSQYLKMFLFVTYGRDIRWRMLDLIQADIRLKEAGYRVDHCAERAEFQTVFCGKHLWLGPGLWKSGGSGNYSMKMTVSGSYE